MQFFPLSGKLEIDSACIGGLLLETMQCDLFIFVIAGRYFMLTRTVLSSTTTAAHLANLFMGRWLIPYGLLAYLFIDNGTQFVTKFFATVCALLEVKHFSTAVY